MKKPTKKQVIGAALFAASFIPAVRGARLAMGAAKIGTKVYRARKAEKMYRASNELVDHVAKKNDLWEKNYMEILKKRKK